jgi:hypothetical protein
VADRQKIWGDGRNTIPWSIPRGRIFSQSSLSLVREYTQNGYPPASGCTTPSRLNPNSGSDQDH